MTYRTLRLGSKNSPTTVMDEVQKGLNASLNRKYFYDRRSQFSYRHLNCSACPALTIFSEIVYTENKREYIYTCPNCGSIKRFTYQPRKAPMRLEIK